MHNEIGLLVEILAEREKCTQTPALWKQIYSCPVRELLLFQEAQLPDWATAPQNNDFPRIATKSRIHELAQTEKELNNMLSAASNQSDGITFWRF